MWDRVRGMLALDLAKVDLRRGVVGLIAIAAAIIFIAVFGTAGMAAGIAALFVVVADTPGAPSRERLVSVLLLGTVGALVTLVAVWAGVEHAWISSLLTFGVVFAGTVAAGFGRGSAVRGLLLSLWAVIALSLAGVGVSAVELAGAYLLGGAVAAVVLIVQSRVSPAPPIEPEAGRAPVAFGDLLRSRIGGFALLRAASVGLATALGIVLYPEHPIWAAITVLLVLRPKPGEALSIGVLRTLGTFAGVVVATTLVHVSGGSDVAVALAFLVCAYLMIALQKVNYAVFVLFLTAVLVLSQDLLGADADAAAGQRLAATALGALISFAALGVGLWMVRGQGGTGGTPG